MDKALCRICKAEAHLREVEHAIKFRKLSRQLALANELNSFRIPFYVWLRSSGETQSDCVPGTRCPDRLGRRSRMALGVAEFLKIGIDGGN